MLNCGINEIWSSKGGFPVDVFVGIVPISIFGGGCETLKSIYCVCYEYALKCLAYFVYLIQLDVSQGN